MRILKLALASIAMLLTLNACSNNMYNVDLRSPVKVVSNNQSGPRICIADVTDNRVFGGSEAKPEQPSGIVLSPDYKARVYARLKNLIGDHTGAMLVPEGKTIASLVKDILTQALTEDGFTVVENADLNDPSTITMAVSVKNFWSWTSMDKVNSDIISDIELDVYTQTNNGQQHINLKNRQTRKVLTDTRTLYKTTTEASLANIYHLACEKFKNIR